jgi:hypothetical protein
VRAVIGCLADRPVDLAQPAQGVPERGAARVADRDVVEACNAVRLRPAACRLPRVEGEMVVVAAGGDEQRVAGRAPAGDAARLVLTTSKPSTST